MARLIDIFDHEKYRHRRATGLGSARHLFETGLAFFDQLSHEISPASKPRIIPLKIGYSVVKRFQTANTTQSLENARARKCRNRMTRGPI